MAVHHRSTNNVHRLFLCRADQLYDVGRYIVDRFRLASNATTTARGGQFLTSKITNYKIPDCPEVILMDYFNSDDLVNKGLSTVQYIAGTLYVAPNYLSELLKVLTGQTTQQHIHDKLIEKAKEKLFTTNLSVSEIAYELGFEHSQSFSKLFKSKVAMSPMKFRASFN